LSRSTHAARLVTLFGNLFKCVAVAVESRRFSHVFLVAPANNIGVARVQFHKAGSAAPTLTCDQRGTRPAEEIADQVARLATVEQRALD
jgi:hypothetical protein